MIEIIIAKTKSHFEIISQLAQTIWREHYTPIIGSKQVEYMLNKFQSVEAIADQVKHNSEYYSINYNKLLVGYICIKKENDSLFLSKIYVLSNYRGKGIGKTAMHFIESRAEALQCKSITLTVNKYNTNSIASYHKLGFKTIEELVIDIGNGFVMDDYKMKKMIN